MPNESRWIESARWYRETIIYIEGRASFKFGFGLYAGLLGE